MTRPSNSPIRFQLGFRGWAAVAIALAILGAITALAIGLIIFVLPVLVILAVLYWIMPKAKQIKKSDHWPVIYRVKKETTDKGEIIDGEFRVIETTVIEGKSSHGTVIQDDQAD